MPLCQIPSRAAALSAVAAGSRPIHRRAPFTTSTCRLADLHEDDKSSHYDVLQVPHNASPAEIKRSFYALSKKHHPDHNPSDPHASRRFVRVSEAYSVLSAPAKRAAYDRDMRHSHSHTHQSASPAHHYASGPAGGRPASGLGRRRPIVNSTRGTFKGPPPSFYRQGGWGDHHEKRKAAHDQAAAAGTSGASTASSGLGGMGPGQHPFRDENHVPHFDNASHKRTHQKQDQRRASRRMPDEPSIGTGGDSPVAFVVIVSVILVVASLVPLLFAPRETPKRRPKKQPAKISPKPET